MKHAWTLKTEKIWSLFLGLCLIVAFPPLAGADGSLAELKKTNLVAMARETCRVPPDLQSHSLGWLSEYANRVITGEKIPLSIPFINQFSVVNSNYLPVAFCLVVFLQLPLDPYWEASLDPVDGATKMNSLPEKVFAGFDENGQVLLRAR